MSPKVKMDSSQLPPPPVYQQFDAQTQAVPQQTGDPYQPVNPPSRRPTLVYAEPRQEAMPMYAEPRQDAMPVYAEPRQDAMPMYAEPRQEAMPTTSYQQQANIYPTQPTQRFSMPPPVMEAPPAGAYQQHGRQGSMGPMRSSTYPQPGSQIPTPEKEDWAPPLPPKPQQTYQTAIPLQNLGPGSSPVDCPVCGRRKLTVINYTAGGKTHLWALVFCFTVGLGCIPYMMESMKDVKHNCGGCGVWLATYLRGGETVVHQHS